MVARATDGAFLSPVCFPNAETEIKETSLWIPLSPLKDKKKKQASGCNTFHSAKAQSEKLANVFQTQ